MKSIYLARHSFAEYSYNKADFDRSITYEGYARIEEQAILLLQKNEKIDIIICSSAKRTQQTANRFRKVLKIKTKIVTYDWLYEDYTTQKLLELFQGLAPNIQSIMLIGHNPNISAMATNFSHSRSYIFNPTSILKLDFDIKDWSLINIRKGKESFYLS